MIYVLRSNPKACVTCFIFIYFYKSQTKDQFLEYLCKELSEGCIGYFIFTVARSRQLLELNENGKCSPENKFLSFINDLPENISSSVRLFADDCVLYMDIESPMDCQILQDDLNTLTQWEADWQIKFIVAKCHSMRMTRHPPDKHVQFDYTLNPLRKCQSDPNFAGITYHLFSYINCVSQLCNFLNACCLSNRQVCSSR